MVDRHPPAVVQENGDTLADDIELTLINGVAGGVAVINKGRDKVSLPGRYGGPPRSFTVVAVVNGDAGMWTVRVR